MAHILICWCTFALSQALSVSHGVSFCGSVPSPVPPFSLIGADYGQISEETWLYLLGIYGGGPEIAVRQTVAPANTESLYGERKIEAETRAL